MLLPDGEELTEDRKAMIKSGRDHYWRLHKNELQWVELCPVCKMKNNSAVHADHKGRADRAN